MTAAATALPPAIVSPIVEGSLAALPEKVEELVFPQTSSIDLFSQVPGSLLPAYKAGLQSLLLSNVVPANLTADYLGKLGTEMNRLPPYTSFVDRVLAFTRRFVSRGSSPESFLRELQFDLPLHLQGIVDMASDIAESC